MRKSKLKFCLQSILSLYASCVSALALSRVEPDLELVKKSPMSASLDIATEVN